MIENRMLLSAEQDIGVEVNRDKPKKGYITIMYRG